MHYELMYPSKYLKASDLRGQDVHLTISAVEIEELQRVGTTKKEHKPIVYFAEAPERARKKNEDEKRLVLNKTNAKTIATLYGNETDDWIGKRITVYSARVEAFGKTVDALRIRDVVPPAKGQQQQQPAPVPDHEYVDNNGVVTNKPTYNIRPDVACNQCGAGYVDRRPVNVETGTCDGCRDQDDTANERAMAAIASGEAEMWREES